MKTETSEKLSRLNQLAKTAQNPKILIEEMRIVSNEAFQIQEKLMQELDEAEAIETNIEAVQELFEVRELVWDTINQIALREKDVKEHTQSREAFEKHQKEQKKHAHESCCCGHHHEEDTHECCGHHHNQTCCGKHSEADTCGCTHHTDNDECCGKHKCGCH